MKRYTRMAAMIIFVTTLLFSPTVLTQQQGSKNQKAINLQGKWDEGGDVVNITQNGTAVTAKWEKTSTCKHGETEDSYQNEFKGTLEGNKLTKGEATYCNFGDASQRGKRWGRMDLTVMADGTLEAVLYMEDVRGGEEKAPFNLKRLCEPDKAKRCRGLGRAFRSIEKIIPPPVNVTPGDLNPLPMPTVSFDPVQWKQTLTQNQSTLAAELDALRKEYCDDEAAKNTIDAQKAILEGLKPGTAQTPSAVRAEMLKVTGIDVELKVLATRSCSVSGPPPPPAPSGICAGVPPKQPGDDQAIDTVIDQLKDSIKETTKMLEEYEREQGGANTTAGQYADYYRTRLGQLKNLKGYWDNIRAATCIPPEIPNLIRAILSGRTDVCTNLCFETAKWLKQIYPGPQGDIQKKIFLEVCGLNCP